MNNGSIQSKEWQGSRSCSKRSGNDGSGIGRSHWSHRSIVATKADMPP